MQQKKFGSLTGNDPKLYGTKTSPEKFGSLTPKIPEAERRKKFRSLTEPEKFQKLNGRKISTG
jgi:hypothetical protein